MPSNFSAFSVIVESCRLNGTILAGGLATHYTVYM
jgi:hypothetical protein